jgi:undecaprenyl-diphosphatase
LSFPSPPAPSLGSLLVLAFVQGVTEFLPVSSDGHLVLAAAWLQTEGPRLAIEVALHIGTLAAVLLVYRRDLLEILRRLLRGDAREVGLLVLGSIPVAAVGLGLKSLFERLSESVLAAALGLLVTAVFLFVGERARRRNVRGSVERVLGWRDALWIGCLQALAPLPGVSRSGTTIVTALVRGVPADQAARFSFLLSVPAVAGAVLLEVPHLVREGGFGLDLVVAVLATFVIGVCALRFLLSYLGRGAFLWCALYCAGLGTVALLLGSSPFA